MDKIALPFSRRSSNKDKDYGLKHIPRIAFIFLRNLTFPGMLLHRIFHLIFFSSISPHRHPFSKYLCSNLVGTILSCESTLIN